METSVTVKSIHIYPVKSLAMISLEQSMVVKRGLKGDRRWIILDSDNKMITQRDHPTLSLCSMKMKGQTLEIITKNLGSQIESTFTLPAILMSGHRIKTQVWGDEVDVTLYEGPANDHLSEFLGSKVKFAYQLDDQVRLTDPDFSRSGDMVSLADGYPILVANQKSLDELNTRLDHPVDMGRFRPNIVVDGDLEAFEEDHWSLLENDSLSWRVVKPCARCTMTTITKEGRFSKEPLRTLSTYRKIGSKVMFGMNVISDHSGEIKVGDKLNVVRV